jgi:xylulokinase
MGIDLGTSGLKTIIVDEGGGVKALSKRSYTFESPRSGYAEHEPDAWWSACRETIREALATCGSTAGEIAGVSFSGQMHGLVALDENFQPIRPAILHCDARSGKQVREIRRLLGPDGIQSLVMNPIYTGFLLPSLLWVRENEPEHFDRIRHVCLPKDYLKLKLTGELSSDFSDASATLAYDIKANRWSKIILDLVEIPQSIFPECFSTTQRVGTVSREAARETGLKAGTIVAAGGGDQVMQGIGNGMVNVCDATVNIGSSGQVSFQIDQPVLNPKLNTNMFCGYQQGRWILFGATMSAGLSLEWWHRNSGNGDYAVLDREAEQAQAGSGGLLFLPYLNGERTPYVDPDLSGAFLGLNIGTTHAHMTRAVMEGVAYSLMQCLEICEGLGFQATSLVASGGAARSKPWLQLQADIYNKPLRVSQTQEQAGLGAAIAAGVGAGVYHDLETGCRAAVRYQDDIVLPDAKRHETYRQLFELYKEAAIRNQHILDQLAAIGRNSEHTRKSLEMK